MTFVTFSNTNCQYYILSKLAKVNGRPGEEKNFYHQFSIEKYSSLPRDTFKTYVERHVTRRKLSLKLIGYCRQSSYTDSEVVFTLLPAVAWVLKSQFAPGYMHFNKCFEGVSGKRGIFHNGKLAIELFFLSRLTIGFCYCPTLHLPFPLFLFLLKLFMSFQQSLVGDVLSPRAVPRIERVGTLNSP